jgi:hypothetical protein
MAKRTLEAANPPDNIYQFRLVPRPLRADVPPFDPNNSAHLRAWENMYDFGVASLREGWGTDHGCP